MINVKVTFKYGAKGQKPNVGTSGVFQVEAKTESAVMAAIRKRYPTYCDIIIVKME
jgi:hypothetical protein